MNLTNFLQCVCSQIGHGSFTNESQFSHNFFKLFEYDSVCKQKEVLIPEGHSTELFGKPKRKLSGG